MQAMQVRRLGDSEGSSRLYIDGRRVSRKDWERLHYGRRTDTYGSRMETRKDGSILVREYHCIRVLHGHTLGES